MSIRWDNQIYEAANDNVIIANDHFAKSNYRVGLKAHFTARLLFLCDMVASCALLPFAIIGICFGTLHMACMWNLNVFKPTRIFIFEKTSHILISAFGATLSPTLAHKIKDSHVPAYLVLAVRITILMGAAYWWFF